MVIVLSVKSVLCLIMQFLDDNHPVYDLYRYRRIPVFNCALFFRIVT
jgi:hypothetical protein